MRSIRNALNHVIELLIYAAIISVACLYGLFATLVELACWLKGGEQRIVVVEFDYRGNEEAEALEKRIRRRLRSSNGGGFYTDKEGAVKGLVSGAGHRRALKKIARLPTVTHVTVYRRIGLIGSIRGWFHIGI